MRTEVLTAARAEARREGWGADFDHDRGHCGRRSWSSLDRGGTVDFPVPVRAPSPGCRITHSRGAGSDEPSPLPEARRRGLLVAVREERSDDQVIREPGAVATAGRLGRRLDLPPSTS